MFYSLGRKNKSFSKSGINLMNKLYSVPEFSSLLFSLLLYGTINLRIKFGGMNFKGVNVQRRRGLLIHWEKLITRCK